MNSYAFQRDGGEWAREEWRAVDRAVYRWVRAHGGSPLLAATAAWTSLADGDADAALPLADVNRYGMPPLPPVDIERLRAEALVAGMDAATAAPFVIDSAQRFYLWRNYAHECAAAAAIRARRADPAAKPTRAGRAALESDLDALFFGDRGARVEAQRSAVRGVAGRRWFVLTGGPGTGKTTTVLRMLLMLQRRAGRALSIEIAAPTGKAAQRLVQALRLGKRDLRAHRAALPADWQPLLDAIPVGDALTVHRLLGYQPWRNGFRRNRRDPIGADVVVVDEASMLDLSMLRSLLDALKPEATLILVGDADQLSSVATGSVLMDIVAAQEAGDAGDLVRLAHSFRAERHLVALNDAVRCGDGAALRRAIDAGDAAIALRNVETPRQLGERVAQWARDIAAAELRPTLPVADARTGVGDEARAALVHTALDALAQRQLLCALRETDFGALAVNAAIERTLRADWRIGAQDAWYPGRAVMITRNDYGAGLFNGDVGLCLADGAGRLQVWFQAPAAGGSGPRPSALRSFAPNLLPAHEGAFAVTIHKSQGSEYDHVAVLLPPAGDHRILSRQLLYTGVSRARRRVELWSSEGALDAALRRPLTRYGGLRERLLGAPPTVPAAAVSQQQLTFGF